MDYHASTEPDPHRRRPTGVAADGLLLLLPVILYAAAVLGLVGMLAAGELARLSAALPGLG